MAFRTISAAALAAACAAGGAAAAPRVAADVAPVHALAARVMQGVGEPTLILPPGASPHGYAMRPSDAAALERAEVVFWVGEALTPWLAKPLETLAAGATVAELADAPGVTRLPLREDARFEAHDHDHAEGAEEHEHDHAAEAGHDHDHDHASEAKAGHDHGHDHDHDHDHGAEAKADHDHDHAEGAHDHADFDAHLWLDPVNAAAWLDAMAATLAAADPANAAAYAANAAAGRAELAALTAEIEAAVAPAQGRGFVVFHDAYQYFETRFGVPAAGAVALSDARAPSAGRVAEVREAIEAAQVACVFAEPQFSPDLARTLVEGTGARVGVLDPLGATLEPGAALYPALMRNLAGALADCLKPAS